MSEKSTGWRKLFMTPKKVIEPDGLRALSQPGGTPGVELSMAALRMRPGKTRAEVEAAIRDGARRGARNRRRPPPPSRVGM